uniref:Uncharacterized protein n=1 Tax=Globisporangium ultimum (strain ATCC 200006 / CBS 805.95 / DAOM BR144) TaxID=431595 RepID=K3X638_GLOUD
MGIKSGMTVEDLKRLTQKRMQQNAGAAGAPATPVAAPVSAAAMAPALQEPLASSRPSTPKINIATVNATSGASVVPKTGMTVQELKQLTTLRLASQSVPMHQSEITGLVSKAVLTNVAKSHYRDSLRNSLTPSSTPKRGPVAARGNPSALNLAPEVRGNRSRSRSSTLSKTVEAPAEANQMRYSYSGGQTMEDYLAFDTGADSNSSQENDSYVRPSDEGNSRYTFDEPSQPSLQFDEDSFPPPPPLDDNGGFVSNSLPSWSPPPAKAKKYAEAGAPNRLFVRMQVSFYNQQTSYYNIASKEENAALDQNAVIAPPPGLSRRPSMTVPWQVAEAVLNTPQTATNRKQLQSPASSNTESETSNLFSNSAAKSSSRANAAEAAAQLSAMNLQMGRQRTGTGSSSSSMAMNPGPPSAPSQQPLSNGARRGSFGNAAEFFKFRRRSKSRLELARDLSGNFMSDKEVIPGFPNYGTSGGAMPGIDERRVDLPDNFSVMANADTVSDASSSSSDAGSSSQDYDDDEVVQITGGYEDTNEIVGNFAAFYHATGAGRGRENLIGLSALSIPPPPPPLTDDEDNASTTSSSKGLPIMSPNGFRLRKVAELARRGSLSSEDKTRAKDEIIQSSLGIGASNAARIFSSKMGDRPSGSAAAPPPGFPVLSATPPRNTPKATLMKTLAPGAGIVRSNSVVGVAPKLSPTTMASRKKLISDSEAASGAGGATLEERLAGAAQNVADCVSKGDMVGFQKAMDELDWLRNEANSLMRK